MKIILFLVTLISCLDVIYSNGTSFEDFFQSELKKNERVPSVFKPILPEAKMTADEIITYNGYPVVLYNVTTADGYIITVQRIPYGINGRENGNEMRKPVVVFPCYLCSAATWLTNTKENILPFILADAGYDVWMGNYRGNTYGKRHVRLSPEDKEFWKFNCDHLIEHDIPSIIDTVVNETGFKQIMYIGHSLGGGAGLAMLSTKPKYNEIVKSFIGLGPAATYTYDVMRSTLKQLVTIEDFLKVYANISTGEFLSNSHFMKLMASTVCTSPMKWFCSSALFSFVGEDMPQLNKSRLPVHISHTPAGSSVETALHFAQFFKSGRIQFYDYGAEGNKLRYGQLIPNVYNMSRITTPIAVFWAENDNLVLPRDIKTLTDNLPSLVYNYRIPYDKFSHIDYVWASNVKVVLYDKVLDVLQKFWSN